MQHGMFYDSFAKVKAGGHDGYVARVHLNSAVEVELKVGSVDVVMRAESVVVENSDMMFGVIRGDECFYSDECFYRARGGCRFPGNSVWEGMQDARKQGDRIGILLDLDQGSMTIWKNGEQLGVMVAEGLSGEYSWAASLAEPLSSARIESAAVPLRPPEEAAAAVDEGDNE